MRKGSKADVLDRTVGTGTFPEADLRRMAALFRDRRYEEGAVLVREGEEASEAFLIVEGTVEVTSEPTTLAELGPGEFVGEMALLDDALRSATVTALTPLRVLVVDRSRFRSLVEEPTIMERMAEGLARRVRDAAPGPEPDETWRTVLFAARRDRRRRRRRHLVATGAAFLALVLVAGVAVRSLAGRSTPVSVDAAVERFRAASAPAGTAPAAGGQTVEQPSGPAVAAAPAQAPAGPRPARPAAAAAAAQPLPAAAGPVAVAGPVAGVYVYATRGFEEVSILGGSRHTYPARTTVTLTANDCGFDVRWDGLEERWDRWSTCSAGRQVELREIVTYHEFFEQGDRKRYECRPGTLMRPASDAPGTAFSGRCTGEAAAVELRGTVVGNEPVTVAGRAIDAVRVRLDETLTGEVRGTRTTESWYAPDGGLLLKRTTVTDADAKATFGSTHYREELSLELTSTEPVS